MSHVATADTTADVALTVTHNLTHLCPFREEVDEGTVTILWRCSGATYELHSLAEYLDKFKSSRISHENLTDLIRHELSVVVGIKLLSVETTWDTAGMEVRCSTSPTPAATT